MKNVMRKMIAISLAASMLIAVGTNVAIAASRRDVIEEDLTQINVDVEKTMYDFLISYYMSRQNREISNLGAAIQFNADTLGAVNQMKYTIEVDKVYNKVYTFKNLFLKIEEIANGPTRTKVRGLITHEYLSEEQASSPALRKEIVGVAATLETLNGSNVISQLIIQRDGEPRPSIIDLEGKTRSAQEEKNEVYRIENEFNKRIDSISEQKAFLESAAHDEYIVENQSRETLVEDQEIDISINRRTPFDVSRNYSPSRAVAYANLFTYGTNNIIQREQYDCTGFVNACAWSGLCAWTDDSLNNKQSTLKGYVQNRKYFGSNWYATAAGGSINNASTPWMRVVDLPVEVQKTSGTGLRGTVIEFSNPSNINGVRAGDIIQFYFKDSKGNLGWHHSVIVTSASTSTQYNKDSVEVAMHDTDRFDTYNGMISSTGATKSRLIKPGTSTITN